MFGQQSQEKLQSGNKKRIMTEFEGEDLQAKLQREAMRTISQATEHNLNKRDSQMPFGSSNF